LYSRATKEKLDRLDNAFLFVISIVGLLITIVQGYSSGILGIAEVVPILILGIPLPFYVGYIRAAISLPQNEEAIIERLRGWGYLIFGIGAYLSIIPPSLPDLIPYGLVLYAVILLLSVLSAGYMQRWFIGTFKVGQDPKHQIAYFGSIASAALLAIAFGYSVNAYIHWPTIVSSNYYFSVVVDILVIGVAVLAGITFEKASRMIASDKTPLNEKQIKGIVEGNFFVRSSSGIFILAGLIIATSKRASILWLVSFMVALAASILPLTPLLKDQLWLAMPVSITFFVISYLLLATGVAYFMKTSKLSDKYLEIK
jgi:hypothetical protein